MPLAHAAFLAGAAPPISAKRNVPTNSAATAAASRARVLPFSWGKGGAWTAGRAARGGDLGKAAAGSLTVGGAAR